MERTMRVTATTLLQGAYPSREPHRVERREILEQVAKEFGVQEDELRRGLGAGASLDELARDRTVSHDRLLDAIQRGLSDALAKTGRAVGGARPERLAEQIAQQVAPVLRQRQAQWSPMPDGVTIDLLA
jgi:hypothetical protein